MAVPPRPIAPELLAEGRRLYEQTRVPVDDIAALLGIGTRTLYTRIRTWGWRRRILRIPRDGPPADPEIAQIATPVDAPVDAPVVTRAAVVAADPAPPPCARAEAPGTAAVAERIQRAVERELAAIERIVATLRPVSEHTEDAERAARVLASLARTLQEVTRLDARREPARSEDTNDDRGPDDPDDFLRELARRMDAFAAARAGDRVSDAGDADAG